MGMCISYMNEQTHPQSRARGLSKLWTAKMKKEDNMTPNHISCNGSTSSACAFTKQGQKGTNQDCMLVWEEFADEADTVFCGVFDGHGPNGHLVARKVRDTLPLLLASPLHDQQIPANEEVSVVIAAKRKRVDVAIGDGDGDGDGEDEDEDAAALLTVKESNKNTNNINFLQQYKEKVVNAYELMDRNLHAMHPKLRCFDSGTTAVTMLLQGNNLIIGNVGDSRAILATRRSHDNGSLIAHQLTTDLKPNLPAEMERINRCKGRVFALEDEPDVARVWLPSLDMPGLAMARAMGDFCLKEYGVSATPQVLSRRLIEEDEFIVIGSDGIWDVLSNEDVVRIVASSSPKETAARSLVHAARWSWRVKHGIRRTDDCSAVCYFIKENLTPTFAENKISEI